MNSATRRPGRSGRRAQAPPGPGGADPAAGAGGPRPAGLLRRLAAAVYDALLLFGVLFVATALVLPLSGGEAVSPGNEAYLLYLLATAALYFGWFWTHGGQTPGMRAWHLRVRADHGGALSWGRAALRFVAALLSWAAGGAGFLWSLVDPRRRAWHDRLSRTVLEIAPAEAGINAAGAASRGRRPGRAGSGRRR